jgi:putative intracellular protease/amidase
MKTFIYLAFFILSINQAFAQSDDEQIRTTLMNYINGTSYNHKDLINKAFYKDANLYLNKNNELWVVPASLYTSWYKDADEGKFFGRTGRILSIDREKDIATAKVEIIIKPRKLRITDLFLLKKLDSGWRIMSKSAAFRDYKETNNDRILFIVSNAHFYGNSDLRTGNSFSEIVNAYHTFTNAGYIVDFVSPEGGAIPLAYINTSSEREKKYLYDNNFMVQLGETKRPNEIDTKNYKAVHYIGGGSSMYGVPENELIQKIVMQIYEEQNGIISSVCHGTAGIVNLKTKDGKYLVDGKRVNGYPDAYERKDSDQYKQFPFSITDLIEKRGGIFKYSERNIPHVEVDGRLVTGQNYVSSEPVAKKIIELLK